MRKFEIPNYQLAVKPLHVTLPPNRKKQKDTEQETTEWFHENNDYSTVAWLLSTPPRSELNS